MSTIAKAAYTPGPCQLVDAWKHMDDVQFGNIPDGDKEQTVFYFPAHKSMVQFEAERIRSLIAAAPEMLEALTQLRKSVVGVIWERMGSTGDESDWFQCQLCLAKSRDTRSLLHRHDCPMEIAQAAIQKAKGGQ